MKDCDGNELAVGDVVEVADVRHSKLARVVREVTPRGFVRVRTGDETYGVTEWYTPSELRLVRRKEPTNAKR